MHTRNVALMALVHVLSVPLGGTACHSEMIVNLLVKSRGESLPSSNESSPKASYEISFLYIRGA